MADHLSQLSSKEIMSRNRTRPWKINNSQALAKGNSHKRKIPAESVVTISFFIGNFQSNYVRS